MLRAVVVAQGFPHELIELCSASALPVAGVLSLLRGQATGSALGATKAASARAQDSAGLAARSAL